VVRRARGTRWRALGPGDGGRGRERPPHLTAVPPPHPPAVSVPGVWEQAAAGRQGRRNRKRRPRGGEAAARGTSSGATAKREEREEVTGAGFGIGRRCSSRGGFP
jgi:hypothetical protein